MADTWLTGWPFDAEPTTIVEVEYRNGRREIAEVCEGDWRKPEDDDMWSPLPENEVIRYRFVNRQEQTARVGWPTDRIACSR